MALNHNCSEKKTTKKKKALTSNFFYHCKTEIGLGLTPFHAIWMQEEYIGQKKKESKRRGGSERKHHEANIYIYS